jgi:hypothetical protein
MTRLSLFDRRNSETGPVLRAAQEVAPALGWQVAWSFSSDVVVPDRQKVEAEILYAKLSSLIMLDDSDIFYEVFLSL